VHSLVVVTWESRRDLARLIDSMLAKLPPEHELVVVDNGSRDDPGPELERWPGPRRFVGLERNTGFGPACNRGVMAAGGDAVVLLNPDTELLDGSVASLAGASLELGALLGPRVRNPDGSRQPSASGPVVGPWPWVRALVPAHLQPPPLLSRTEPWRLERETPVAWLTGACIAAPRRLLERLGPFDERIELMSEDLDLCLRAEAAGVDRVFAPQLCAIVHHGGRARRRRYEDAGLGLAASNRRRALARAYGARRERRAWRAEVVRLGLRALAYRAIGRDAEGARAELAAARKAGRQPLPPGI
jgi:GT2 family glycosyltransferase